MKLLFNIILIAVIIPFKFESRHDPFIYISQWDTGYCNINKGWGWNNKLIWPTDSHKINPNRDFTDWHQGIDIIANIGDTVKASTSGIVIWSGNNTIGFGNTVIINSGQYLTIYAHLDKIYVKCGQYIKIGKEIGTIGMTGATSYPHLHFELRDNKYNYDPKRYLK